MTKINSKEVIQSYIMTTAKYDFSVYEKRILYRLVEMLQYQLEGKKLDVNFTITEKRDDKIITMPIKAFLIGEEDKNHALVKQALLDLESKRIIYEDDRIWKVIRLIQKPVFIKYDEYVEFELQDEIYQCILNFSKGFSKFELKTAMMFHSTYAMRFYELLSNQKNELIYTVEHMKIMFGIEDKYIDKNNDFIRKVIDAAKKELDKLSPYSFEYEKIYKGKKIHAIKFKPVFIAKNRDENIEKHELQKQVSLRWDLDKMLINYLKQNLLFSEQEIKNNMDLFKEANTKLDLMLELSILGAKARGKKNEKGYIINALKGKLDDYNSK